MDVKPRTLYRWYRFVISDFVKDNKTERFAGHTVYDVELETAEVKRDIVVHILKKENVEEEMCIDEKMIGQNYALIFSAYTTGKIALLVDTVKPAAISQAIELLENDNLLKVKKINSDMSPTIMNVVKQTMPKAEIVIDKFHVMKHVVDAVNTERLEIKKELKADRTIHRDNPNGWTDIEFVDKAKYWLIMKPEKLQVENYKYLKQLLDKYPKLKEAYTLINELRVWYDKKNIGKPRFRLEQELERWMIKVEKATITAFIPIAKMIEKHQEEILGYFEKGLTNAKAENLNSRIQRFLMDSYGSRDRDFFFYRCQVYFA